MEQLIPVVNKLQDVFGAIGHQAIDLPQIVVVGSQSSGKSSVLENIVGRDFLPRGTGIVTRRPMVLQLYSLGGGASNTSENYINATDHGMPPKDDKSRGEEWGEFLHLPGQRFYDFSEIRGEIARETERVTGKNKGISNKSINLKIYSPYVLNLTLVDLPGVTKVPTGDQPEDVEEQIRSMCFEFISNPNAIILAVTAANQDLANSDGLKMARAVDPEGDRTIGVLTKVDIMDSGTDCLDILSNKVIPLKKGYIAVVNRSQKDIQDGLPIRQGLLKESTYFQNHSRYRNTLSKCGTSNLSRSLNQILMHHIRDCLPDIKSKIMKLMHGVVSNLTALGDAGESQNLLGGTLLRIISKFTTSVNTSIEGRGYSTVDYGGSSSSMSVNGGNIGISSIEMTELYGGARISFIFNEIFGRLLWHMDPFECLDDDEIRTAIANANGTRPSLFVPEISFDLLVRRQISRLEAPGLQCVDMIFDEMLRLTHQCELPELTRFPLLRERVFEIVGEMLKKCMKPTQQMISNMVLVELAYINTSHPDFIGGKQALALVTKKSQQAAAAASAAQQQQTGSGESGSSEGGGVTPTPFSVRDPSAVVVTHSSAVMTTPVGGSGNARHVHNAQQQHTMENKINNGNTPPHTMNTNNNNSNVSNANVNPANNAGFFGLFRPPPTAAAAATGNGVNIVNNSNNNGNNMNDHNSSNNSDRENSPPYAYPLQQSSHNITTTRGHTSSRSHAKQQQSQQQAYNNYSNNNNNNNNYQQQQQQNPHGLDSDRDTSGLVKLPQMPDRMKVSAASATSDWGKREVEVIKTLIRSYFDVVRKTFVDVVPKTVMHFLVNGFRENLQNELVAQLYREPLMQELMRETDEVAMRRKQCVEMRELLQRALEIVNEVRDFKATVK